MEEPKELSMKALLLSILLISPFAHAAPPSIPPGTIPGHDQIPPHIPNDPNDGDWRNGGGGASCAPEVVEGNVAATERTLRSLALSPEFADASTFRAVVSRVAHVRSAAAKVAQYFALIGIDSRNRAAVADFVGARAIRPEWLGALERTTDLNADQSAKVASELQQALRGNLQ